MSQFEVAWSRSEEEKFAVLRNDSLQLFKVQEDFADLQLNENYFGSLLASSTNAHYTKCLCWGPCPPLDNILAVALNNGHMVLTSFGKPLSGEASTVVGKEFSPRHNRMCTQLAWNTVDTNLIAQSMEKQRTDCAVLVWDCYHRAFPDTEYKYISKPCAEIGQGEGACSVCWFTATPKSFITGINNKILRIYDLRDSFRPRTVAYTKGISQITVEPNNDHHIASCSENEILIWDTRNFEKPVLRIHEEKAVARLKWSTVRSNLLSCVAQDSEVLHLYDIHQLAASEETESCYVQSVIIPFRGSTTLSSIDWHHTKPNELLMINSEGTVILYQLYEKITMSCPSNENMAFGCGPNLYTCNTVSMGYETAKDVLCKIRRRASKGYGVQKDILVNSELVDDSQLSYIWSWLHYVIYMTDDTRKPVEGLNTVLNKDKLKSEARLVPFRFPTAERQGVHRTKYFSKERSKALELCGIGRQMFLDNLISSGDYSRAAALAVFNMDLKEAIEILTVASKKSTNNKQEYTILAMALAGFDGSQGLWQQVCSDFSGQLSSTYLKVIFKFLTTVEEDYSELLADNTLFFSDRMTLACLYLPDIKLLQYVNDASDRLISEGNLDGLLLTGLNASQGMQLLQAYLDHSGDIQTVSALVIQTYPCRTSLKIEPIARHWVESYRLLLDQCRLWHQRCDFDIYCNQLDGYNQSTKHVFICCNFCGKTVGHDNLHRGRTLKPAGAAPNKITSCPECNKPLPRCSVCLLHMGTAAARLDGSQRRASNPSPSQMVAPLSEWFSWCQTCRHGGHTEHVSHWFGEHEECPVTGCLCRCNTRDFMEQSTEMITSYQAEDTSITP